MLKWSAPKLLLTTFCLAIISVTVSGQSSVIHAAKKQQNSIQCPADLPTLTSLLLKDFPSYANRVIQRSRRLNRQVDIFSYILIAGLPDFEPLPLKNSEYQPVFPDDTQQVFFTTLEREYRENKVFERQNFHWLFLTKTSTGWRMVMTFSRFDTSDKNHPLLPPIDTTNGVIGQAINLWLRDCRAGSLRADYQMILN